MKKFIKTISSAIHVLFDIMGALILLLIGLDLSGIRFSDISPFAQIVVIVCGVTLSAIVRALDECMDDEGDWR